MHPRHHMLMFDRQSKVVIGGYPHGANDEVQIDPRYERRVYRLDGALLSRKNRIRF